jgi:hypothetical protein
MVLVDHTEGFCAYKTRSGDRVASYITGEAPSGLPYKAAFGENSRIVVVGGGQGKVYVFDVKGGAPVGMLWHARGGRVQNISVRTKLMTLRISLTGRRLIC